MDPVTHCDLALCDLFFLYKKKQTNRKKRKQKMKNNNKKKIKKIGGPWTRSMKGVHGPGPKRGSMDQGSMFCPLP